MTMKGAELAEMRVTLSQDDDCCGGHPDGNTVTAETHDGGGGHYLVMSATRWAMDDDAEIDALAVWLKSVLALTKKEVAK